MIENKDNHYSTLEDAVKWTITSHNHPIMRGEDGVFFYQCLDTNIWERTVRYGIRLVRLRSISLSIRRYCDMNNQDPSFPLIEDVQLLKAIDRNTEQVLLSESREITLAMYDSIGKSHLINPAKGVFFSKIFQHAFSSMKRSADTLKPEERI